MPFGLSQPPGPLWVKHVDFAVSGQCPVRGQDRKYRATLRALLAVYGNDADWISPWDGSNACKTHRLGAGLTVKGSCPRQRRCGDGRTYRHFIMVTRWVSLRSTHPTILCGEFTSIEMSPPRPAAPDSF